MLQNNQSLSIQHYPLKVLCRDNKSDSQYDLLAIFAV